LSERWQPSAAPAYNTCAAAEELVWPCTFDCPAVALVALLSTMLIPPATASAEQSSVVLLTLVDGTACRGPITGTTFSLIDQRANYACTDGRWIIGEPLALAHGRQTAMLARTVQQSQPVHDDVPCTNSQCPIALEQAEVATAATLPRIVSYSPYAMSSSRVACTFQDDNAFYLGGVRANYLCDPTFYQDRERAGAYYRADGAEYCRCMFVAGSRDRSGSAVPPNGA